MATAPESGSSGSLKLKLWRGERMCLLGMDVANPDPGFVGFAIEVQSPGGQWTPLRNRLAFDYPAGKTVSGNREYPTTQAPIQTFRWIHFPYDPQPGRYGYRVTMMHMDGGGTLSAGDSVTCSILLCDETAPGFVDIGFTRNFASSQAFADKFPDPAQRNLILPPPDGGLTWPKKNAPAGVYDWLGGKANDLLWTLLKEAQDDPTMTLDVMAYDLNEPDLLAALLEVAKRTVSGRPGLRILIDNSGTHKPATSCESVAATQLEAAGAQVVRHHFDGLQHNKVIVARKSGAPYRAIGGSTNFSFRGLYIQANNMLAFDAPEAIELFARMFELALTGPHALEQNALSQVWQVANAPGGKIARICFSPHPDNTDLSLSPLAGAIQQASSSVLYAVAFLNQDAHGPTRKALDDLMDRPVFSYGIANRRNGLRLTKPDGSTGLVDFEYLSAHAPEPFSAEWSGGAGITIHHKFVVVDFNLPTAKLFAGSSNLSVSGEKGNGDHLIQISDQRIATAYAVEALRMFDHLNFRTRMKESAPASDPHGAGAIRLKKPPAAGEQAWFAPFYVAGSQRERDRILFSS
jgi:hypothetical protein